MLLLLKHPRSISDLIGARKVHFIVTDQRKPRISADFGCLQPQQVKVSKWEQPIGELYDLYYWLQRPKPAAVLV